MPCVLSTARSFICLCFCTTCALAGCGKNLVPTYPVCGVVRFSDGSPVNTGTIELECRDQGTTSSGRIQKDGTFVLGTHSSEDGAPAGSHQAIVLQMIMNDGVLRHSVDHGLPVDPKYASYESSPLRVDIEACDRNEIEVIVEKTARVRNKR